MQPAFKNEDTLSRPLAQGEETAMIFNGRRGQTRNLGKRQRQLDLDAPGDRAEPRAKHQGQLQRPFAGGLQECSWKFQGTGSVAGWVPYGHDATWATRPTLG